MKGIVLFAMLALLGWNLLGNDGVPVAISPGSDAGVAAVGNGCPTFSWGGVAWAQKYRVVVFGVEGERTRNNGEAALTSQPVLSEDVAGGGYSWTPGLSRGLAAGADYAWCVGAMDADGAWSWSATKRFRVEQGTRSALSEEDAAAMKEKKETAAAGTATDTSAGNDAGKKDATDVPSSPMGLEGTYNTTWGLSAGASITSGTWNTFIGRNTGSQVTTASNNTFIGDSSGILNTSGYENTFLGRDTGYHNTTGYDNTFIGDSAGVQNTIGNNNTFLGKNAGAGNTTGGSNTFIGKSAGASNTTGTDNTFIGEEAGTSSTSGYSNTFLGYFSGSGNTTGYANTFIGNEAGSVNSEGSENTFIGTSSGRSNGTGEYNTFLGYHSGRCNTSGGHNTFLGYNAGFYNTGGSSNLFVGWQAGVSNTTGYFNTFIGMEAGTSNLTGYRNVFLGYNAGYNETGSEKLYIENSDSSAPLIYGDFSANKVGINGWLGVGTQAPAYPMELKTTGRNAAIVANRTDGAINFVNATTTYGQFGTVNNFAVRILANAVWRLTLNTDNSLAMASGATCTAGGVWTNASSRALKENISNLNGDEAATTLRSLNPVKYNYKADKEEKYVGFIAEEVPELVSMNDRKSLSAMDIVAVLTKVAQEQLKMVQEQQKTLVAQEKAIAELKEEIVMLKRQFKKE